MKTVTDIAQWAIHGRADLWFVLAGPLALAALDHMVNYRRAQRYDAWWCINLRR